MSESTLAQNLAAVRTRIQAACDQFDIEASRVQLLAVSKTFPAQQVREAAAAGLCDFGENYVQEGIEKIAALQDLRSQLHWHFIGPLQSNKTKEVALHFDWMHSLEREKIAQRLSEQRPASLAPLKVCIQVNVSGEASKSGVSASALEALCLRTAELPGLSLRGLMAIPEPTPDIALQRSRFRELAGLFTQVRATLEQQRPAAAPDFNLLSMGMSADLESAIAETPAGARVMVRIGTAIFGLRQPAP